MKENHKCKKAVYRATLLGLLTLLAACGGGGDDEVDPCESPRTLAEGFACMLKNSFSGLGAPETSTPDNVPSTAGEGAATEVEESEPTELARFDEFEPNNSLDNANIVQLPAGTGNVSAGVEIVGSVHSADDPADYFIFTPSRSNSYSVYLCADTCAEILQDDAVFIMIYDQNQTTIASTSIGGVVTQELAADLTAGLAYYVEVQGYNTGEGRYDYRLVIVD